MRRTKLVCTVGPSSATVDILAQMMQAGMNVARFNFSHGEHRQHAQRVLAIQEAQRRTGKTVALLLDTKGPEIRLGKLAQPVDLKPGAEVILTTEDIIGTDNILPVTYASLPQDVDQYDRILIDDGLISLKIKAVQPPQIICQVENGGQVTSNKGVNVPEIHVNLPAVTEEDVKDIIFGIDQGFDFVAASFVRRGSDVIAIRKIIEDHNGQLNIIAKIENREAVRNLEEIIKLSDGIMVARGDLGVEIPPEEVPLIQKTIIEMCNFVGKPVITATQMLESMMQNPRPTRAEASDVANAILDGTDAVMLSGETAAGKYPVEAVETMDRIARRTETAIKYKELLKNKRRALSNTVTDAISHATVTIAQDLGATAIITSTESGYTAKMVSKYRPKPPVIAVTPLPDVLRKLALVWGVEPLLVERTTDTDEMISAAVEASLTAGLIKAGDLNVITAGVPAGVQGTTNLIKVHTVGDIVARGTGIGNKAITGKVCLAHSFQEAMQKLQEGEILVTHATNREFIPAMAKAAAIVVEEGGLTSHAAIVGLEFGVPTVVGVQNVTSILPDGETITVDGIRGLIYRGAARVL